MKIGVYYIESNNPLGKLIDGANYELIKKLSSLIGREIEVASLDEIKQYDFAFTFIGGGGTEGLFLKILDKLPKPVFLLATSNNNSLAAAMEILSYLNQNDIEGEIIHGSLEKVAKRLSDLAKVFEVKKKINNFKIARVGKPSDWLISSDVDALESKRLNGIEIIDVEMEEFFEEISKNKYQENEYTGLIKTKDFDAEEIETSLYIYGALKRLCDKYNLDGVTVRCFDLLEPIHSTGCVALAILNAEGIYASCEGDVPSLVSMAVLGELTGKPIFQANPSMIDPEAKEMILAHCTLPVNMVTDFYLMTHYESGLGVALRGKIPAGDITLFKSSGLLDSYFVSKANLIENLTKNDLCRSQIKIQIDDEAIEYFFTESIGNHHLICTGDYVEIVDEFFKWI
ncbi:MAG: hypothetical protein ACOX1L_07430 [Erysipelotrichaceae bacterium]|jgi:L-fucose isomerase-like protein